MTGFGAPRGVFWLLLVLFVLAACDGTTPDTGEVETGEAGTGNLEAVAAGRVIAERNCAGCHAIGPTGASPNPASPPLRLVLQDFDIEALATDFREHIKIGGEQMPEFDFGPKGTDALMAYLLTIEVVE